MLPREPDATFSHGRRYRYSLYRPLNPMDGNEIVTFVLLNPSIADENKNDPTIRRCIDYGRRWGFHGLMVVNLFGFCATDPKDLFKAKNPVGNKNISHIMKAARKSACVVCAWGCHGAYLKHGEKVRAMLDSEGIKLTVLGVTKDGHPRHPLRLHKRTKRIRWKLSK